MRQGQGRTVFLFYAANLCHDWGVDVERAVELVDVFNKQICDPPESGAHVSEQVEKVYRNNAAKVGGMKVIEEVLKQ